MVGYSVGFSCDVIHSLFVVGIVKASLPSVVSVWVMEMVPYLGMLVTFVVGLGLRYSCCGADNYVDPANELCE